jgi:hypothetical protein
VHKFVIDRLENEWAVIETLEEPIVHFNFPKNILPQDTKEGDVINIDITIDKENTKQRKNKIQNKLDSLKKQDRGDDITL